MKAALSENNSQELNASFFSGTKMKVPESFNLKYTQEEIRDQVKRMGGEITSWCREIEEAGDDQLLAVPVLRGAIFFFADLVRDIDASVDVGPVRSSSYEDSVNAKQLGKVSMHFDGVDPKGRHVLIVDDICDSGRTLKILTEEFLKAGSLSVRSAVLIKREIENPIFDPEYVGFDYTGKEWFAGYGMDDEGYYRNLPEVHTLKPQDEKS